MITIMQMFDAAVAAGIPPEAAEKLVGPGLVLRDSGGVKVTLSVSAATDHGVALAILTDGLPSPRLRIQCECGWYDSCGDVIDFDAVARSVNSHRRAVAPR